MPRQRKKTTFFLIQHSVKTNKTKTLLQLCKCKVNYNYVNAPVNCSSLSLLVANEVDLPGQRTSSSREPKLRGTAKLPSNLSLHFLLPWTPPSPLRCRMLECEEKRQRHMEFELDETRHLISFAMRDVREFNCRDS